MSGIAYIVDAQRLISSTGSIASGTKIYFYYSGTSVLAPIYTDHGLTIPAANPVTADASGFVPLVFMDSTKQYRRYAVFPDGSTTNVDPMPAYDILEAAKAAGSAAGSIASSGYAAAAAASAAQSSASATSSAGSAVSSSNSANTASLYASAALAYASGNFFDTTTDALSKGVVNTASLVGGSAGTNGTFALSFSGGGGSGAAGVFVVAGGAVTQITITSKGVGYTSAPTISFSASTGLTGASATAVIGNRTSSGDFFLVKGSGNTYGQLYKNVSGVATDQNLAIPSLAAITAIIALFSTVPTVPYSTATDANDTSVAWGIESGTGIARFVGIKPGLIDGVPAKGYVTRKDYNRIKYRAGLHYTSWMGQSKMASSVSGGPHITDQRYGMIAYGYRTTTASTTYPLLAPSQDVQGTTAYLGTSVGNEFPAYGIVYAGEYAERQHGVKLDQINLTMLVCANATGSTSLASNARGGSTHNFENTITQVTAAKSLAVTMGLPFVCEGVMWSQGEGGNGDGSSPPNGAGYTLSAYKASLKNLSIDLDTTIRGITGGTNPVNLFCVQTNTPSGGGAAITNDPFNIAQAPLDAYREFNAANPQALTVTTTTTASAGSGTSTISIAANSNVVPGMVFTSGSITPAWRLSVQSVSTIGGTTTVTLSGTLPSSVSNGGTVVFTMAPIIAVTPEYMVDYADTNTLHYGARDSIWLGGYLSLAYHRTVIEGVRWQPLTFVVDQIIGNYVHLRAVGAEGPIVIDRSFIPAQDDVAQGMISGFTCRDPSNNIVAVQEVTLSGTDGIRIKLASTLAGNTLKYAKNQAVLRDAYVGGCGNIRDSLGDRLPKFEGNGVKRYMHKWAMADQWSL